MKVKQKSRRGQQVAAAQLQGGRLVAGTSLAEGTLAERKGHVVGHVRLIDPRTGAAKARNAVTVGEATRHVLLVPDADAAPGDHMRAFIDVLVDAAIGDR